EEGAQDLPLLLPRESPLRHEGEFSEPEVPDLPRGSQRHGELRMGCCHASTSLLSPSPGQKGDRCQWIQPFPLGVIFFSNSKFEIISNVNALTSLFLSPQVWAYPYLPLPLPRIRRCIYPTGVTAQRIPLMARWIPVPDRRSIFRQLVPLRRILSEIWEAEVRRTSSCRIISVFL